MSAIPEDILRSADRAFDNAGLIEQVKDAAAQFPVVETIARAILAERERHGWQPIETFDAKTAKGPWTDHVMLGHSEKKWIRFGRYDLTLKRWYYSGTNERSQWAQVEGDAPTHWMPLPSPPKP